MKITIVTLLFAGTLCAVILTRGSAVVDEKTNPPTCNAPLGWWESKDLQPLFINPDGPAPTTNCDFQVWSWTAFVHWTQVNADGTPKFLELKTPEDLNSTQLVRNGKRILTLKPRTLKPKTEDVAAIQQAGSQGVIVDQFGRAVYYSQNMDPIYFNFAKQYFGKVNYAKAAPDLNFPIGATVFKASWRVVQPGEDTSKIFTTMADIAKLVNADGKVVVEIKDGKPVMIPDVKVALVGLHVVGVIKDHPEFVWATFEHLDNAPDLPANIVPNSLKPVSAKNFTFYKAGTPAGQCNQNVTVTVADVDKQTLTPITNIFRQYADGGASPARAADIDSSNKNFQEGIVGHAKANKNLNPVFANYSLEGSVWLDPTQYPLKPGLDNLNVNAIASISLANATMETYVQGCDHNCFYCHSTVGYTQGKTVVPGKNINLSHLILGSLAHN